MEKKIIIVAGGTGGIGSGIVRGLVNDTTKIYFTYNSGAEAAEAMSKEYGPEKIEGLKCDVTNYAEVTAVVESIADKEEGKIDALVNAFGITKDKPFIFMEPAEWHDVVNVNLHGVFNVTRRVAFYMAKKKSGSILNLSSVSGIYGLAGQTNYSATKAAIIGFSRALARELSPRGIRVNTIAPGFIRTPMVDKLPQQYIDEMKKKILLGRIGEVEDLIGLVQFLMSEKSSYITNQVFVVDGGMF
jgi:3-oxoacyl-[acyl-carrier protein] reductase